MRGNRRLGVALLAMVCGMVGASPPPVTLADPYPGDLELARYWVSEKFDGVRGYWNGDRLLTRSGATIDVPDWFTEGWPETVMDGELWAGYGRFSSVSTLVRTAGPEDPGWRAVSYHVFDLPAHGGDFDARVPAIRRVVAAIDQPWVVAVRQFHVADDAELDAAMDAVLARGGEGLILHHGGRTHQAGRNAGLFKLKPYQDAEARVVAINPGQGRLQGMMGSVEVVTPDGRRFAIGSGFTDEERANPPPVGAWITYRYNGETANGLPRFARFLRLRPGGPPPEVEDQTRLE